MADRTGSSRPPPAETSLLQRLVDGYILLAQRGLQRGASYVRDVADLTRQGSIDPRSWIGSVEDLWSGLGDDLGDVLRTVTDRGDTPNDGRAGSIPIYTMDVPEGVRVQLLPFEVPLSAFDLFETEELEVDISGLWGRDGQVLRPRIHLRVEPRVVTRADRHSRLRLFDLPDGLRAPITLVGPIHVHPPRTSVRSHLIALVKVQIA